jgi:hypothetical protein
MLCWSENSEGRPETDVTLTLESDNLPTNCQITVLFRGVRDFRFVEVGGRQTRITGLEVRDISDRQWEQLRWEVVDFEDDSIRFLCRDIILTSARQA